MEKRLTCNNKIKIGVIGCGQISQIMHLPFLKHSNLFEIEAICDVSRNVIERVGELYDVPVEKRFLDYKDLLNVDIDACLIATMDHFRPTIDSLEAGKHVYVEKPLAFNLTEADKILELSNRKKLTVMVGYMKLYDPAVMYVKQKIKHIEKINLIHIHDFGGSFSYTRDLYEIIEGDDIEKTMIEKAEDDCNKAIDSALLDTHKMYKKAYNGILGLASHDLAVLRYLFGQPKVLHSKVYGEDLVVAQMEVNGVPIQFETAFISDRNIWDEKISIYGDTKNISIKFPWPYLKNCPTNVKINEDDELGNNVDTLYRSGFEEGYHLAWVDFYNSILTGEKPLSSAEKAREDIKIACDLVNLAQKTR